MEHNDIRHKLSEYLDGSITAREKADIEEHLKGCQQCSGALSELRKTVEHIKQVEDIEPPSWMTQKIMATVRADAQKKSLFQRLFYPLAIKLPIQAVVVVFLAVTAFSLYRNIQPAQTPSETLMQEFAAQQEAPQKGARAKEHTIARKPPDRLQKVPRSPGYKALDMKLEYEKPGPPKPVEQPMPGQKKAAVEERFAAPQGGASAVMKDEVTSSTGLAAEPNKMRETGLQAISQSKTSLDFQDYRVMEIYKGKPAPVDFSSHPNANTWKAMLREAAIKGPNFAGHYTIALWGCGTSCAAFGIIDAVTGKVYFPNTLSRVSWAGWWEKEYGLKFRTNSNLLKVYGSPNEQDQKGIYYYIWKDNKLELIKSDIKK